MPALREEIHADPRKRRGDLSALPARDGGGRPVERMRSAGHARHLVGRRVIAELLYRVGIGHLYLKPLLPDSCEATVFAW